MKSEAVLVATPSLNKRKQAIIDELIFRIEAVEKGKGKNILALNTPDSKLEQITKVLLTVFTSPTIMPLAKPGWSSLHSVINECEFWEVLN